jgi:hypothetical protein
MLYLALTTGVVAVVAVVALMLALNAVRRLKSLEGNLLGPGPGGDMYPMGMPVGHFDVVSVDGVRLTRQDLTEWTLVAAVTPDCRACHAKLPEFLEAAAAVPGGRDRVIAIVGDSEVAPPALVSQLEGAARVVVGAAAEEMTRAFAVTSFPMFMWVNPLGIIEFGGRGIDLTVVSSGAMA